MTLTEFLLARIAEDEESARTLQRRAQEHELNCQDPRLLGTTVPGWYDWPDVQALTARVLAECAAKRRIVAEHVAGVENAAWRSEARACQVCVHFHADMDCENQPFPCPTLRYVAAACADHPDYHEEWRP